MTTRRRRSRWNDPKVWVPLLTVVMASVVGPIIVIYYQNIFPPQQPTSNGQVKEPDSTTSSNNQDTERQFTNTQDNTNSSGQLNSVYASTPIVIDGVETGNEWDNAAEIPLEHGMILVKNDDSKLYLLIDVVGDAFEDVFSNIVRDASDYVNLIFDVNLDKLVTPDVDVSYITYNDENTPLSIAYFNAPGSTSEYRNSESQVIGAFGSSTNLDELHRIWEFAIDRNEINVQENRARMGINVNDWTGGFDDIKPPNYMNDFSNLTEISLASGAATNTTLPSGAGNFTNGTIPSYHSIGSNPSAGITIGTDKPTYVIDETVVVSGSVAKPETGQDVRIDIYNSLGQVFWSALTAEPDIQGRYSTDVHLTAYFVKDVVGEYKAVATYNGQSVETKFTVESHA
jgi:hypothetical protein